MGLRREGGGNAGGSKAGRTVGVEEGPSGLDVGVENPWRPVHNVLISMDTPGSGSR